MAVKQNNNPLFKEFDVSFENFNSVSSYSTAATLRLLRANCGQETEITMYQGARGECNLLDSLQRLGYRSQVFLDHNGVFGDYLKTLRELAAIPEPIYPLNRLKVQYNAFDGAPIYSDHDVFAAYMEESSKNNGMYLGFMNLISLHDGNRLPGKEKSETYPPRLKLMLENLTYLVEELKKSSRRTMLVVIPEHGAAIRGDKMQIARLREIPTTKITNVPLLVKFFNLPQDEILDEPIKIHGFHSYLALSELIKRAIENNIFSANDSLSSISEICASLPQQAAVSESTNAYFMVYKDTDFYKLKGDEWNEYKN